MTDPTAFTPPNELFRLPCSIGMRSDLLYLTEWADALEWEQIQALAEYVEVYQAEAGVKVFEQGGEGHYLCLLVKGSVAVSMTDSSGKEKTLATIDAGKPFGEMSLIDGEPRSATAAAVTDCTVMVLTQEGLKALSEAHPKIGSILLTRLAESMSHRLRQTSGLLVEYLED